MKNIAVCVVAYIIHAINEFLLKQAISLLLHKEYTIHICANVELCEQWNLNIENNINKFMN